MREAAICGHVATQGVVQQLVADQRIHEQAAAQAVARIQRHAVGLAIAAAATLANIAAIASIPQRGTHREGVTEPAVGTDGDTIGLEVDSAALAALVAPGADRAAHPQAQRCLRVCCRIGHRRRRFAIERLATLRIAVRARHVAHHRFTASWRVRQAQVVAEAVAAAGAMQPLHALLQVFDLRIGESTGRIALCRQQATRGFR
ncbi:hypothetical protein G6F40_014252 [Rhizopus arrhizus]|nr:hypothetical protein G6F40_014252 [Rhizopus arrhizus]